MRLPLRPRLTGAAIAGLLIIGSVSAAAAASLVPTTSNGPAGYGLCRAEGLAVRGSGTVAALKAFGDCEIARRFTTLNQLSARINASKVMTSSDKTSLTGQIADTTAGLTSLKATIDAQTSISALRAEIARIANDYRVYILVAPKVHLVNTADGVAASQALFDRVETNLVARIARAQAAGKDVTAAQASLDAMKVAVTRAVALATPLPAQLLPLTPAQYNGGTAGPVLRSARTALGQARDQLQAARADARAVLDALK